MTLQEKLERGGVSQNRILQLLGCGQQDPDTLRATVVVLIVSPLFAVRSHIPSSGYARASVPSPKLRLSIVLIWNVCFTSTPAVRFASDPAVCCPPRAAVPLKGFGCRPFGGGRRSTRGRHPEPSATATSTAATRNDRSSGAGILANKIAAKSEASYRWLSTEILQPTSPWIGATAAEPGKMISPSVFGIRPSWSANTPFRTPRRSAVGLRSRPS